MDADPERPLAPMLGAALNVGQWGVSQPLSGAWYVHLESAGVLRAQMRGGAAGLEWAR